MLSNPDSMSMLPLSRAASLGFLLRAVRYPTDTIAVAAPLIKHTVTSAQIEVFLPSGILAGVH